MTTRAMTRRRFSRGPWLLAAVLAAGSVFAAACGSSVEVTLPPGSTPEVETPAPDLTAPPDVTAPPGVTPTPTPPPIPTAAPTATPVPRGPSADVGCLTFKVEIGPRGRLAGVSNCNDTASPKVPLQVGESVQVSSAGEAVVDVDGCALIYVFMGSELRRSGCSSQEPGNTYCALSGTSAMNNQCTGVLQIETPSAVTLVDGTYFSVSYDPETEITIVTSFEDTVTVFPLTERGGSRGQPAVVEVGEFYFTAPDAMLDDAIEVMQLEPRVSTEIGLLPGAISRIELEPYYGALLRQAAQDQVIVLEPEAILAASIRAGGGVIENDTVRDGLLLGLNWQLHSAGLQEQGYAVSLLFDGTEPTNAAFMEYDPAFGREVLAAATDQGVEFRVIAPIADQAFAGLIDSLLAELDEFGLTFELVEVQDQAEGRALYNRSTASGVATLWIGVS